MWRGFVGEDQKQHFYFLGFCGRVMNWSLRCLRCCCSVCVCVCVCVFLDSCVMCEGKVWFLSRSKWFWPGSLSSESWVCSLWICVWSFQKCVTAIEKKCINTGTSDLNDWFTERRWIFIKCNKMSVLLVLLLCLQTLVLFTVCCFSLYTVGLLFVVCIFHTLLSVSCRRCSSAGCSLSAPADTHWTSEEEEEVRKRSEQLTETHSGRKDAAVSLQQVKLCFTVSGNI